MLKFDLEKKRLMLNQHMAPSTPGGAAGGAAASAAGAAAGGEDDAAAGATAGELARQLKGYTKHSPPSLRE